MPNKWRNFGDINYLAYGGLLVRKDAEVDGRYEVFRLDTEFDISEEEQDSARLYTVDIDDIDMEKLTDMLYAIGLEDHPSIVGKTRGKIIAALGEERVVKECIECFNGPYVDCITFKTQYPESFEDTLLSKAEVEKWLKELGADIIE